MLELSVDREKMVFSGMVTVRGLRAGRPSKRLTFHQNNLKITKATIARRDKGKDHTFSVDRINLHKKFDEVRLHTREILYPGPYTVTMEFEGKITRPMNGVYPCVFEHKNTKKKLIATQFESHHAREVFPCIDEPEAKATFDLALTTPAGETVISNTPAKSAEAVTPALVRTSFETTPKMSTYLLAFVYGELGYREAATRSGVVVRTYATPDNVAYTQFALDIAVKCLEFYNDYFGIDYPLPKCDFVALPDFASGAMENWGCITFREQTMLVDPKNSTLANKQYVALVVAHELTHQWFGNLVTMRWWTDLWLNEGFASWMEYLAIDSIFPEWQLWTQFAVDEQQQALKLDALEHTHPIEVPVHHPDEIRAIFDAISYSKGAGVIHMLHEYLGHDAFRDGLRHYLNTHSYGNTDTADLWDSLELISGKPVSNFMHAWTSQSGFPLVNVAADEKHVHLSQTRFFINPHHVKTADTVWPVPLLLESGDVQTLDSHQQKVRPNKTGVLKLNRGQSGFYRVAYNHAHLEKLGELIINGQMEPLDRLGVLNDLFETAKSGQTDTIAALEFLSNYKNESNYAVWDSIATVIGNIRLVMDDERLREAMKPYIRQLVSAELKRLGWNRKTSDSHFDQLLRPIILGLAANADEPDIVLKCQTLFAEIEDVEDVTPDLRVNPESHRVKRGIDIDPDLRGTVFGTVARLGGQKEFDKLLRLHNTSHLSEEKTTIAAAITGFKQPELVARSLDLIDSDEVRLQDAVYWIAYSFLNRHAKGATWEWLKHKWPWLQKNLGTDLSFYRMPIYSARVFSDEAFLNEFIAFFKPKLTAALDRSYKQGIEMLQWQTSWKQRELKSIKTFFSKAGS